MKFKQFLYEGKYTNLFKIAKDKKLKDEFREQFEIASGAKIDHSDFISSTNINEFVSEYNNKFLPKYKSQIKKMYNIWDKGTSGPGEMMLAYISDNITIAERGDIDLKFNNLYIEMKSVSKIDTIIGTFTLGASYAKYEKQFIETIYKMINIVNLISPNLILPKDMKAIEKMNLNKKTIDVLKSYDFQRQNAYEFVVLNNGDVFYNNSKLGNILKEEKLIKEFILNKQTKLTSYNELETDFSLKVENKSSPFIFMGIPSSKTPYQITYVDKLHNLHLYNIDQNGPKYYIER